MEKLGRTTAPILEKLKLLVGIWKGSGEGDYPTILPFAYQEIFSVKLDPDGRFLTYEQDTKLIDLQGRPLRSSHWETGILKPHSDGILELACVQGDGRLEVLHGEFTSDPANETAFDIHFRSMVVANDERVRHSVRVWSVTDQRFNYTMSMWTTSVEQMTLHLEATLIRG